MENNEKLELYLINGPLGAGKTTFLRELLTIPEFKSARVIENEFASKSVDTEQLHDHQAEVKTIAGVCICCSTGEELTDALRSLANSKGRVIIEATGVANSLKLIEKLVIAGMLDRYTLKHAVFILDAVEAVTDLQNTIQSYSNELKAADTVLISKTDLVSIDETTKLMESLQGLKLNQVSFVREGKFNTSLLKSNSKILDYFAQLDDDIANHDTDASYTIIDLAQDNFSLKLINSAWNRLVTQYGIRRLKGNLYDEQGRPWHVEATPKQLRITPYSSGDMQVILIGTRALSVTPSILKGLLNDGK